MTLPLDFYARDTLTVARELLGTVLISRVDGRETSGMIVETEAYLGLADPAAHSYKGRTERVRALYEGKGLAYIYLIYGMYWCLNFSTGPDSSPDCVLIRALEPLSGIDTMAQRRKTAKLAALCSGPGKLCMALGVTGSLYGARLYDDSSPLRLEPGRTGSEVNALPRVGIDYAGDAKNWLWNFSISGNKYVSKRP